MRRTWFSGGLAGCALAGLALAGLALAGCTQPPPARQQATVASCTAFSVNALRHHVSVTAVPAACRGLTKAQANDAASAALHAITGTVHGATRLRARARELGPLLAHLVSAVPAQPGPPPAAAAPGPGGPPAGVVALIAWLATVGLGSVMMARWITRTGFRHLFTGKGRPAAALNFAHFGLAVAGLLIWAGFLLTGLAALAWVSCALLLPVAGLGMTLISRWFPDRSPAPAMAAAGAAAAAGAEAAGARAAGAAAAGSGAAPDVTVTSPARADPDPTPVQHPPVLVVTAHVVFAVTTILFTVRAAIGAG